LGGSGNVYLNGNVALGQLNIVADMDLLPALRSIFVDGDVTINANGARLVVVDSPNLRDLDADAIHVARGTLELAGGVAQADESLRLDAGAGISGLGVIEMNSTTGNLVMNGGGQFWALGSDTYGDTLLIRRTDTSTSRLDWTDAGVNFIASFGKSIVNELPYTGALGGSIHVNSNSGESRFESTNAFVAGAASDIHLTGSDLGWARLVTPVLDSYGLITARDRSRIDSPLVALRGSVDLDTGAQLSIPANVLIFDSLEVVGDDASIVLPASGSTLDVTGGLTEIHLGTSGAFDLDGTGNKVVHIDDGSTLLLDVGRLDTALLNQFDGILEIEGTLIVDILSEAGDWANGGEIVLDGGEIHGSRLDNMGVIRGTGYIDAYTNNVG
ncbi:MAG: hypothetical protein KDA28_00945, partial [Phycisphaerales bacterium]|nr:hypothetical protein [Phycisphaerales bacterium]